jgi:hypothetical protein
MVIPRQRQQLADRANTGLSDLVRRFAANHREAPPCNGAENAQQWNLAATLAQAQICKSQAKSRH